MVEMQYVYTNRSPKQARIDIIYLTMGYISNFFLHYNDPFPRDQHTIKKLLHWGERYIHYIILWGFTVHNFRFSVVIEKDDEGYSAFCPELQGCYAQGETYEEVLDNIKDAIRLHIDDRIESGEKIPQAQLINLTTVDVSV
jgi:predicted RNase H-like HicB family nuclease